MIQYSSEKNATVQFRVSYGISSAVQIRDICVYVLHLIKFTVQLYDSGFMLHMVQLQSSFTVQFRDSMYSTAQRHVSRWVIGYSLQYSSETVCSRFLYIVQSTVQI